MRNTTKEKTNAFVDTVTDLVLQQLSDLTDLDTALGTTIARRREAGPLVYRPYVRASIVCGLRAIFDEIDAAGTIIKDDAGLLSSFSAGLTPERLRRNGLGDTRDKTLVAAMIPAIAASAMATFKANGDTTLARNDGEYLISFTRDSSLTLTRSR